MGWKILCLSVDGGGAEVVFSTHHHSGGNQVDPRMLVSRCSSSLANTENRKLRACLVDVRWEYRDRAAVDLDHQSA